MSTLSDQVKSMIADIVSKENIKDYVLSSKEDEFIGQNYSSKIIRVDVRDSDSNKSLNLLVKVALVPNKIDEKSELNPLFKAEINAYKFIIPVLNKLQEDCGMLDGDKFKFAGFYSGSIEEFKEIVIFKDMSCEGFQMIDKRGLMSFDLVEMVLKKLAIFHATSFVLKKKDPECFATLSGYVSHAMNYPTSIVTFIEKMRQSMSKSLDCPTMKKKFEDGCGDIAAKLDWILDSTKTEPYNVICHGDCWINNMLFKYSGNEVVDSLFLDLQLIRLASPVTDLIYFLLLTLDRDFRQKYFKKLLEIYYDTLSNSASKMGCDLREIFPRSIFHKHLKECSVLGLFFSLLSIPFDNDPSEQDVGKIFENLDNPNHKTVFSKAAIIKLKDVIEDMISFDLL